MGLLDPLASSIRRMGVAMAGDLGAGIAKRYGNGGAETGRSAGDESNSIVKSKHGSQKIFAQGRKNIDQHHFLVHHRRAVPALRRKMKHVARLRDALVPFDEEPHPALLYDRHLLVRMVVLRRHQKWLETKAANHHLMAHQHLALDSVSHLLDGNVGPVQVPGETICGAVAVTRAVSIWVGGIVRHFCFYFLSLTASRPDPLAAYSGCTFTTPYKRSSPSLIAAIIHRKLICPPGAATFG